MPFNYVHVSELIDLLKYLKHLSSVSYCLFAVNVKSELMVSS